MKRRSFLTTAFAAACAYAVGPSCAATPVTPPRDFQSEIDAVMAALQDSARKAWDDRFRLAYQQIASRITQSPQP